MNIIYKGLQRSQISNVGLASTLTCLYGDISNHYALNLGHCFSVEDGEQRLKLMVSKNFCQLVTMATRFWNFPKKTIEEEYLLMSEACIEIIVFLKETDS